MRGSPWGPRAAGLLSPCGPELAGLTSWGLGDLSKGLSGPWHSCLPPPGGHHEAPGEKPGVNVFDSEYCSFFWSLSCSCLVRATPIHPSKLCLHVTSSRKPSEIP